MADLDLVEKMICERYNVASLPSGALTDAMALARGGDESLLREVLAERELYRWREPIEAALGADPLPEGEGDADEAPAEPVAEASEQETTKEPRGRKETHSP